MTPRNAVASPKGGFGAVALVIVATQFASIGMVPVLPSHAMSLGATVGSVGLVIAGFGMGRLVANLPAGMLAERWSPTSLLLLGSAGVVVTTTAAGVVHTVGGLLLMRCLIGLAAGFALTSGLALIGVVTASKQRGRSLSKLQLFQLLAASIGPLVGGAAAAKLGTGPAFFILGAVAGALLIAGAWRLPRGLRAHPAFGSATADGLPGRPTPSFHRGSVIAASGIAFAIFLARFGGKQTLLPLLALEQGMGTDHLGLLLGGMSVFQAIGVLVGGAAYDRFSRKAVVGAATLVVGFTLLIMPAAPVTALFVLVTIVFGFAQGVAVPTSTAFLIDVAPPARLSLAMGVYRSFGDLAGVVGPLTVGWLVGLVSSQIAGLVLAAMIAFVAAAFGTRTYDPTIHVDTPHQDTPIGRTGTPRSEGGL